MIDLLSLPAVMQEDGAGIIHPLTPKQQAARTKRFAGRKAQIDQKVAQIRTAQMRVQELQAELSTIKTKPI